MLLSNQLLMLAVKKKSDHVIAAKDNKSVPVLLSKHFRNCKSHGIITHLESGIYTK